MSLKIEFVSYTGRYPNLCSGVLTIKIDGKEYKFGHEDYDWKTGQYRDKSNFDKFWVSGGGICKSKDWDMWADQQPWIQNQEWDNVDETHPQWVVDILPQLLEVFNENVSWGCCGGCI